MTVPGTHPAEQVAVVGPGESITYGELLAQVPETQREVVAVDAKSSLDTLLMLLGALRAGSWALPLNPGLPEATRRAILTLPRPELPGPGVLVLTSGSSGMPKAAMLPLAALLANAERSNANIPLAPDDRWLLSLPLFHVSGLGVLFRCWAAGAAVALPAPGTPLLEAIQSLRPTHISLVATQLRRLMAEPHGLALLAGMKAILLGGSAMPEELIRAAHAAGLPIHKSYGMTEMCSQVATTRPGASMDELMTSGYPLAPDSVRVSTVGEIEVRGETLFRGYLGLERRYSAEKWFATGDLGYFDAEGRLVVLGRKDNMYISGGENIHPEEVERAIAGLPGVEQVIVIDVPDAEYGAVGFAFVEGGADLDTVRSEARALLPGFKVPKYFQTWPGDLAGGGIKPSRADLQKCAVNQLECGA